MAAFNPSPPETQANPFLNWSRPIGNVPADKSSAMAIETLGTGIEGTASTSDSWVKGTIRNDIYAKVDPLRDAYTASLEAINNGTPTSPDAQPNGSDKVLGGPQIAQSTYGYTPQSAGTPQSLLPDNTPAAIPPSLQNGLDRVGVMAEAAKQGGHYNDTKYTGDLTAIAKQLRAQYPGYRPYIDEQISSASGIPIANAYVRNLIQDANTQAADSKSQDQKIQAYIMSRSDLHGQAEMYQTYMKDKNPIAVMQWASKNDARVNDLKNLKLAQEVDQGSDSSNTTATTRYVTAAINKGATDFFINRKLTNGQTPAQMSDSITRIQSNPDLADDVSTRRMAGQYQAGRAQFVNETRMLMTQPGADGKSPMEKLGAKVVMDQINSAADSMFSASSDLLFNKDYAAVHLNHDMNVAVVDSAGSRILGNSKIGGPTADISAITKLAPQAAPVIFSQITQNSTYVSDLGQFTSQQKLKALSQRDYYKSGSPYTLSAAMDQQKAYADQNDGEPSGDEFKSLTDLTSAITHPKTTPELQRNAFSFFFDPKNIDNMLKFKEGYYDPSQKRWIQGREAAFAALTSEEITKQAYRQRELGHPEVWENYKNWAQHEAGVHLIRNDVANLNDIAIEGKGSTEGERWHLSWNSDSHRVGVAHADGRPLSGLEMTSLNMPYRSMTNINNVLGHMQNIAKVEGTDVDAYFYSVLNSIDGPAADKLRAGMKIANGGSKIKGNLSDQPANAPVRTGQ